MSELDTEDREGCFADKLDDSETGETEQEGSDELIVEELSDYSDDSKEPQIPEHDDSELGSDADLTGFESENSRITDDPDQDEAEDGMADFETAGAGGNTGTGNTKRSQFLSKVRKSIDGDEIGPDGPHGFSERKSRKPRSEFRSQKDREEYEWACDTVQVRQFLLEHFPKLMTDVKQRSRAARWLRLIQMCFLARMSDAQIVFQLYGVTAPKNEDRDVINSLVGTYTKPNEKSDEYNHYIGRKKKRQTKLDRLRNTREVRNWIESVKIPEKEVTEFDRLRKRIKKIVEDIRLARKRGAPKKKSGRPKGSKDSFQRKRPKGLRYNVVGPVADPVAGPVEIAA